MKVVATARGYDNKAVREIGEEFEMPEGAKGSWFKPIAVRIAPPLAPRPPAPAATDYDALLIKAKELGLEFVGRPKKIDLVNAITEAEQKKEHEDLA